MLDRGLTESLKDIQDADAIIASAEKLIKSDKMTKEALTELTAQLKQIPQKHRIDEFVPFCKIGIDFSSLSNEQQTNFRRDLNFARLKKREEAELLLQFIENALTAKPSKDQKTALTKKRETLHLTNDETKALQVAKDAKAPEIDLTKMLNELQENLTQKTQEARKIKSSFEKEEVHYHHLAILFKDILDNGYAIYNNIYSSNLNLPDLRLTNADSEASMRSFHEEIDKIKRECEEIAQEGHKKAIESLKTELAPLLQKAKEIQEQSNGKEADATEQLDSILLESDDIFKKLSQSKHLFLHRALRPELELFQTSINKIRDEISLDGVKPVLVEATTQINALHERIKEIRKTVPAVIDADPIAKFEGLINQSTAALKTVFEQFERDYVSAINKCALLGIQKVDSVTGAEGDAFRNARDSFLQGINELKAIEKFVQLFKDVKAATEAINKAKLAPGVKTLEYLSNDLTPIRKQLGTLQTTTSNLQSTLAALPKSDLNDELKSSLAAIASELSDTAVTFTKLDDLVTSQKNLVEAARQALVAVAKNAATLNDIKDNETELTKISTALAGLSADVDNKLQAFLKAHCPVSVKVEDFLQSNQVSAETREVIAQCINAIALHKKEIDTHLERAKGNKPANLVTDPASLTHSDKEAIAASRARLARAEELFNLTHAVYLNAENNPILRAKLYKTNENIADRSFNDYELRNSALEAARAEVEAQIRISKGDKTIDIAPLKKATDDAHQAAEDAEKARRDFSKAVPGTAGGITAAEQYAIFKKQMHPLYIDRCIRTLTDLEKKAQLLTESAYNEEHITKIELQAQQIKKDLSDYLELINNIANDQNNAIKSYTKSQSWPTIKKVLEDKRKLESLTRPSSHRPPVHTNLFTSIEEKVHEARTNHATKKPERFAHFAVRSKEYKSTDKNAKKQLETDISNWIGTEPTVKPQNVAFVFSTPPQSSGEFEVRLSMCQIEVNPPLLEREANQLKYAVAEELPSDKSYYKATFYANEIGQLARIPDAKRWVMIYESYMRGLATGVKPDLRIPPFPKSLHSVEIDFKAVGVAYGLLNIETFYGSERKDIEKRVKKIESAAAAKNPEIPATLKSAAEMDAATNSLSASTRLIPGRTR